MLNEYKQLYKENADLIPDWKSLSRSELCFKYVECDEVNCPLKDNYLSAIIYKFWNVAEHNYYSQQFKLASEEDCYNWNIDSIIYCLEHRVWKDPKSNLYNDPDAPEKAINVHIYSTKINFYVAKQRQKRKEGNTALSLDALLEENPAYLNSSQFFTSLEDMPDTSELEEAMVGKISNCFDTYQYMKAFILDAILHVDVFSLDKETQSYFVLNEARLKHYLRNIDEASCFRISNKYNKDIELIKRASKDLASLSYNDTNKYFETIFINLKLDPFFLKYIKGESCAN